MNYIQQAYKGQREIWMFLLTTAIVGGVFFLNFIIYLTYDQSDLDAAYDVFANMPSSLSLAINLIPFAVLLGLLFLLVKFALKFF